MSIKSKLKKAALIGATAGTLIGVGIGAKINQSSKEKTADSKARVEQIQIREREQPINQYSKRIKEAETLAFYGVSVAELEAKTVGMSPEEKADFLGKTRNDFVRNQILRIAEAEGPDGGLNYVYKFRYGMTVKEALDATEGMTREEEAKFFDEKFKNRDKEELNQLLSSNSVPKPDYPVEFWNRGSSMKHHMYLQECRRRPYLWSQTGHNRSRHQDR